MHVSKVNEAHLNSFPGGTEAIRVLVGRHETAGAFKQHTVCLVELKVGASSTPHFHRDREESYFVLSGDGEAVMDGQRVEVSAGVLLASRPGQRHHFVNTGSMPLRYLVFTAPSWIPEDSHA